MPSELVQHTISWLANTLPDTEIRLTEETGVSSVDLPFAPDADYRFRLWFYDDGERGITAEPLVSRFGKIATEVAFWSWPFELAEFHGSVADLAQYFDEQLRLLLPVPTRVRQHRGWLFFSFVLEHQIDRQWQAVYRCASLRFTFRALASSGADRVYHAGPVLLAGPRGDSG